MKCLLKNSQRNLLHYFLPAFFVFISHSISGQTTQTFNSSGTWTFTVGVTSITAECWGGGGSGGGSITAIARNAGTGRGTGNETESGGAGLSSKHVGNGGNSIGGGGGGAGQSGLLQSFAGGSGADGQVIITYTTPPTITGLSSDICAGGSITITGTDFIGITAADVKIGTTAVSSITSYTSTQIIAVVNSACSGNVNVSTVNGTVTSTGIFTSSAIPAAPVVTTPVNYCVNATASQLTATGSNLAWGNEPISGTAGGSTALTTHTYLTNSGSNKKTNFTTTAPNVKITTVNYYLPAWQAVDGLQLGIFNSSGTLIATSSTITTLDNGSNPAVVTISNTFNYTIAVAGNYSIGVTAGSGTVGGENSTFPITEPTGTIIVTGAEAPPPVIALKPYHCFNNIQFTVDNSATAPTPSTSVAGTTNYLVNQTVNGCESPQASIAVIVDPASVGGYVNSNAAVCSGANGGTLHLTGQTGNVLNWEYSANGVTDWTTIVNNTTSQDFSNLNQTAFYRAVVKSGVCPSINSNFATIIIIPEGSWTGSVSTDWNDIRNWVCGQVPTSAINVAIAGGANYYPVITSGVDQANNIIIQEGGSLTVGNGTLQIFGNINNSGILDATNGNIEMNGSSAQTIAGNLFADKTIKNLIVSNTGTGLSVSSATNDTLKITGTLSFGNSNSKLYTGDNLTLVSNNLGTANVGILGDGNAINGKVIVERYINIGTAAEQHAKSWQLLATPTLGQSVKASWMEDGISTSTGYGTMVSGSGGTAAGFDVYTASPSIKNYDPFTDKWVGINNTDDPVYNQSGYFVFVRGDRSVTKSNQPPNNTILRTKGILFTGELSPIEVMPNTFQSVGNPYASVIDFPLIHKDWNIDDKFYVWDPYLQGTYGVGSYQTISSVNSWEPIPGGTSAYPTGVPNSLIQSGQGFLVHSTVVGGPPLPYNPEISFTEDSKATTPVNINFARPAGHVSNAGSGYFRASLFTGAGANDIIADGNAVVFNKNYSDSIDGNDALKLTNSGENFGVKRDGKILVIEARPPVSESDTVYYNLSNLRAQTYQLRFSPENMESTGLQAFLLDKFLNTSTPISLAENISVNISITSNPGSSASDRFKVVFSPAEVLPVTFTSLNAILKNEGVLIQWEVSEEINTKEYDIERSVDGIHFTSIGMQSYDPSQSGQYQKSDNQPFSGWNFYRIKNVDIDGKTSFSPIVKVNNGEIVASIKAWPNPVVGEKLYIRFDNQPEGEYNVVLFNGMGQQLQSVTTYVSGVAKTVKMTWNNKLPKAIYTIRITSAGSDTKTIMLKY